MNKKQAKIIKYGKRFALSFLAALIGSLMFQYFAYGIPMNRSIKDIENIESVTVSQGDQIAKIDKRDKINEAILFTNFLYIKLGKVEEIDTITEYLIKFKDGETKTVKVSENYISINGKVYRGNEKYLTTFNKVVSHIILSRS